MSSENQFLMGEKIGVCCDMYFSDYTDLSALSEIAQSSFAQGSTIRSDGYRSYIPALEGFAHEYKSYQPGSGLLHWLHIIISNAKAFILGTYHGLPKKNLQSYLDEYSFRFSRRNFHGLLTERLSFAIATSVRLN